MDNILKVESAYRKEALYRHYYQTLFWMNWIKNWNEEDIGSLIEPTFGARYADDFIILVRSQRAGERVLDSVTKYVQKQLKLKVNEQKSQVVPIKESKFLGFSFKGKWLVWHPKALSQFKWSMKRLTKRTKGISMETRIKELNRYLIGWINYFGIADQYQLCVELDSWIRRRIRQCYWKRWRKVKTTKSRRFRRSKKPVKTGGQRRFGHCLWYFQQELLA